jgi:uncharacterized protein (TIGR02246 family)
MILASDEPIAAEHREVGALIGQWADAFAASDVDGVVRLFSPGASFIGTLSLAVTSDGDAIRRYFELSLAGRKRSATMETVHIRMIGRDAAVAACLGQTGELIDGTWHSARGRLTFVAERQGGLWTIAHFHRSAIPGS